MKYIVEEGTHKKSKSIFIFTGTFLIFLSGYQLFDHLQHNEFNTKFPGDWDKLIGIVIGVYLIFRSRVFTVRSRDLFVEITDTQVISRMNRKDAIFKVERSKIDKLEVKKGKVIITTRDSIPETIIDFNKLRIRDNKRESIIDGLKQELNN